MSRITKAMSKDIAWFHRQILIQQEYNFCTTNESWSFFLTVLNFIYQVHKYILIPLVVIGTNWAMEYFG